MCGNGIGQTSGFFDAADRGQNFRRNLFIQLDVLVELSDHRSAQRLDFMVDTLIATGRRRPCDEHIVARLDRINAGATRTFDQHLDGTVWQLEHLQDVGHTAHTVQILGLGLILDRRFLGHQENASARFHSSFERFDRLWPADEQRDYHVREDHHIAQGQERQVNQLVGKGKIRGHCLDSSKWNTPGRWG